MSRPTSDSRNRSSSFLPLAGPNFMPFLVVGFSLQVTNALAGVTPDLDQSLARRYVAGVDAISVSRTGDLGQLGRTNTSVGHAGH